LINTIAFVLYFHFLAEVGLSIINIDRTHASIAVSFDNQIVFQFLLTLLVLWLSSVENFPYLQYGNRVYPADGAKVVQEQVMRMAGHHTGKKDNLISN